MMTFFALLPDAGTRLSTLAIELPRSITPAVAGLTVGLFVGVVGVIAVMLLVGRGDRRGARRARVTADQVVFIPPYGTMQRDTPLPPRAFANGNPGSSGKLPIGAPVARAYAYAYANAPNAHHPPSPHEPVPGYGFLPSSALSARVLAKMGRYDDDLDSGDLPLSVPVELPSSIDVDMTDAEDAVLVSPVVMVSAEKPSAETSAPHPLGIIKSTSEAMRPASIADLSFDDGPTEIGETYFDHVSHLPAPPQLRRRTDLPKIRAIAPAAPRFPEQTPRMPQVATTKNDRQHP